MKKLHRAFDTAFPLRLVPTRKPNAATWITRGIRNSSKKVRLFNIVKKQILLSNDTRLYITKYNRIYKRIIKEAKRREMNRFLSQASNKAKATWKIINKERGKQLPLKQDITLVTESIEVLDSNTIADMFHTYFCNKPNKLWDSKKSKIKTLTAGPQPCNHGSMSSIYFNPVSKDELVKVAGSLKNKLTAGSDDIPDYVIKQTMEYLIEPLVNIYNTSLETGIFPEKLKIAKVIPVHKKGDIRNINNYRPIATLSVFSKLLEKLVYNRVINFIEKNGLMTEAQHGFRTNRSTVTVLQKFITVAQTALDKKMYPIGLFMDLSKAYDVLDHKLLLYKLAKYGIREIALQWMESYLTNRKQYVEVSNVKHGKILSSTRRTNIGVPQGSILGPILFSLFINDLPLHVPGAEVVLYADDTNLLMTGNSINAAWANLNVAIQAVQSWFSNNNLIVNIEKTSVMQFRNHHQKGFIPPRFLFEDCVIPVSNETKFLGIHINDRLKWDKHCDSLKSKLNTGHYLIYRLKKIVSPHVNRIVYFTRFHSHLRYKITIWGSDPHSSKIFMLQKK
jgi:hypothetical protein